MSPKKHDAVFDGILTDLDDAGAGPAKPGSRFLKRSSAIGEHMAGEREEKLLQWVDPASCRMWARHNRDYALLNEETCRDLIDGIRAQGKQEFPAIVRRLKGEAHQYEVICGARRHFAISWLRANTYPQFKYLIEVRDLTDEEAFRLADIENRERDDISDYERARDYASAIDLYYGGKQKAMAARLDVSEAWLSRYLALARLPDAVIAAFPSIRDVRELHARVLKPLLAEPALRTRVLAEAGRIAQEPAPSEAAAVVARLRKAAAPPKARPQTRQFRPDPSQAAVSMRRAGRKTVLEVPDSMSRSAVEAALKLFVQDRFGDS